MNSIFTSYFYTRTRACLSGGELPQASGFVGRIARCKQPALLAAALVVMVPALAGAQGSAAQSRIIAPINESNLTTLRGNTHPLAKAQYDQGAVAESQPIHRMLLLLQRSAAQDAALKQLVDNQQSKSSPNYHQWLTPQQIGQQYGPADADIQTVTDWLTSHGFQIARVSAAKTLIEFSGTAGQVRSAFHTQIHRYVVNGEAHFANSSDPQIPTALAPVVAGPVSLNNFPHKPLSHNLGVFRKSKATGEVVPLFTFKGCGSSGTANCNALGPGDFAAIYNVQKLWTTGINGHVIDGTGQTIAIVGDSEICTVNSPDYVADCSSTGTPVDDVATFRSIFGLPANSPNVVLDGPDPGFNGDEIEGNLDVQWSGAVAKNATIDFVIAANTEATAGTDLAAEYIVDNNLAPVMSESFTACEAALGFDGNLYESILWEQAAAQGITVVVAAGDNGSAACDDPNTETAAGENPNINIGATVNGLASTPFNVAAGGTDFDITLPTTGTYQSTYWNGGNATVTGGAKDVSATSYIPETTWNDSCAQFESALTGCSPTNGGIVAGGGGQSNCVAQDNDGNCYYYAKPSWQTVASGSGLSVANDLARDLPDISLFAADGYVSNSFYAICDANFSSGPCDATPGFVDIVGVGGTSSAAPTFAGIMALVNQNVALNDSGLVGRQGNANYVLYNLAKTQATSEINCNSSTGPVAACTFNDVTKGNNSVPCVGGTFGCSITSSGTYGILETDNINATSLAGALTGNIAWSAAAGLDLATGLGSINAYNLVNNWTTAGPFMATTTTLCLSAAETSSFSCSGPVSITHGKPVYVNIEVNGPGGTPIPSEAFPTATFSFPDAPTLAEDVSLVGTNGNTGAVDRFSASNYVLNNFDVYPLTNGVFDSATASTTAGENFTTYLTGGNYSVIAHYSGDGTYGSSFSTTPIPVTVTPETSTTVLSAGIFSFLNDTGVAASSGYYGDSIVVRADVYSTASLSTDNPVETATGSVTLFDGTKNLGAFPLNTEGYAEDQTGSMVTGAFTPALAVGAHSFTATFSGDPSYITSSTGTSVVFTVQQAPTTAAVTSYPTSVPTNTAFSLTAFVDTQSSSALSSGGSSGAAPTGTVTFFAGSTQLGTAPVTATTDPYAYVAGRATLTGAELATASNVSITAVYNGDTNYTASAASPPVTILVTGGPTFSLSPSNGTGSTSAGEMIVNPGQPGMDPIMVSASSGYSGTVTLTVASVSPGNLTDPPTCSFGTTGTITLSSTMTSGSGTLTCSTTAQAIALFRPSALPHDTNWFMVGEIGAVIAFIFSFAISGRRRRGAMALLMVLFAVVLIGTSCGSGGSTTSTGGGSSGGTTAGSYTVTIMATSGGISQTSTVTLIVN